MAATLTNYSVNTNINGVNGFGRQPAKKLIGIYNTQLAATTDKTVTVPNTPGVGRAIEGNSADKNQVLCIFGYEAAATMFVGVNVTTAAPDTSGTITAASSCINPSAFILNGGDTIHVYPTSQKYFSVEFYSIN